MKKLVFAALAAVLAFCLSGCGMTTDEYKENLNVQYFVEGDFLTDLSALTISIPIEEEGDLDYEAWNSLEEHCENIINLEGCPKEYEEAHENLVKAANNLLGQIDLIVDCAANLSTYRITGDTELLEDVNANINAMSPLVEQVADYVKKAKEIIESE